MGREAVQITWVAAGILPELKKSPGLWNDAVKRNPGEALVRMVDEPPVTDGAMDAIYAQSGGIGDLAPVAQGEAPPPARVCAL